MQAGPLTQLTTEATRPVGKWVCGSEACPAHEEETGGIFKSPRKLSRKYGLNLSSSLRSDSKPSHAVTSWREERKALEHEKTKLRNVTPTPSLGFTEFKSRN